MAFPGRPGGTLSNASHDVMTTRPIRSGPPSSSSSSGPPQVVDRERRVAQVEPLDELAEQSRDPGHREVGVRVHRMPMRAQRQRGEEAAVVCAQVRDDVAPQRAVHHQAVREHDRGPVAAGVLVVDGAGRQLEFGHDALPD